MNDLKVLKRKGAEIHKGCGNSRVEVYRKFTKNYLSNSKTAKEKLRGGNYQFLAE